MDRRGDNMAGGFVAKLDDVFAEVGFNRFDIVRFEKFVEADFLGDHRLALGHRLRIHRAADIQHDAPRVFGGRGPVHHTARGHDIRFECLQVEVQVFQRMVLDVARLVAQRLELRQARGGGGAIGDEAGFHLAQRRL